MATINLVPLGNYPNGTRAFGPRAIPDFVSWLRFSVARCTPDDLTIWPNESTQLSATIEVSLDGGATWPISGTLNALGGIQTFHGGAVSAIAFDIPSGTNRQVRGTATVTGGPLRSSVSVDAT